MASVLDNQIRRLRRRVRLLMVERYGLFGASVGAVVAAVLVLLSSRYDQLISYPLWGGVIALGAAIGGAYGLLRKLDDLSVAVAADKRTGLRERLSTAVQLSNREGLGEMEGAVVDDADEHISGLRSREIFRHRFGAPHVVFGVAFVLFVCAVVLPMLPAFQSALRRAEIAAMKREGAKLTKIGKEIDRQADPRKAELKKLAAKLQDLGKKMETGRMARKQAMLKTQKLTKEVEKQQNQLAEKNSATKSMEQANADMKRAADQLAKQMAEKLSAEKNVPLSEAMKMVPSDPTLAKLVRKDGPLTSAEQKQLEEAIAKYTDPNNNSAIPSELGAALAKLAANKDYQKASELMQQLAKKMGLKGTNGASPADKEAMKKQMEALAKALKNTDLGKLAEAMKANAEKLAKMSPEELKNLARQMQEAQKLAKLMQKAAGG